MDVVPQPLTESPQLRTLLLTDLCDSTELVERLGDAAAAELFREHDILVLRLQQQWRGRLIDRSDGLLLLFERPIDGLGFALDYQQGLRDLGHARGLRLLARAGLHVGEVLTWRNSAEAVQIGAKPLEVEGLAKPVAARLMALARPGQTLLSAVAESLTQRAARELGERGERLLWKSHGYWRFKGMPTRMEVYEVGEIGLTPLRAPKSTQKAWRDIPLWRRPAALVAEVAVVAMIAVGGWLFTRPEPAIAFAERDWVVVGDMRNLTGDVLLDDSLEQALRISLEQSKYINVISDRKSRQALQMMRRDPGTTRIDRENASEIALRTGAAVVLLPTVADVGGRTRVSVEVVRPETQETVFVASAEGRGHDATLGAVDAVATDLRERLGEEAAVAKKNSVPLPEVTTSSLEALRAYALAQKRFNVSDYNGALGFYQKAAELDPQFALAALGQVRCYFAMVDTKNGLVALQQALSLGSRLPPREAMYLDGWSKELLAQDKALVAWEQMAAIYPDYAPAQHNASIRLMVENRFKEALAYSERVVNVPNDLPNVALDQMARVKLALGDYEGALTASQQAKADGYRAAARRVAMAAAAKRDFARAERALSDAQGPDPHASIERASIAADQGNWREALRYAQAGLDVTDDVHGFDYRRATFVVAVAEAKASMNPGDKLREVTKLGLAALRSGETADWLDDTNLLLSVAIFSARNGEPELASRILGELRSLGVVRKMRVVDELMAVADAWVALSKNDAPKAQRLVQPYLDDLSRYQSRVVALEAARRLGDAKGIQQQETWLDGRRGLAYAEFECGYCLQLINVTDSNAILAHRRSQPRVVSGVALP
ncbi:putative peptide modification system cyclase [Stenotrophomonas sp. HITSZ_GD]|uniref:putative peptide modification system cyclase n=1 Tax=Stenotrophomonas sp. HITSZ_GD TaxID=3037248 RepID=UPI00240D2673|nr:putative peptide modification system cyclase [Stenotrophomonas sp. HITSZ_GD]MDG2523887.1 putative peptide modification system cyclase [Stenotrophomonas sp. HITSZ_GD]